MKNSKFKWTKKEQTVEAEETAAKIIVWVFFCLLVIPAAGVTYVITKDTKATLDTINSLKPGS